MAFAVSGSADWRRTENRFLASLIVVSYPRMAARSEPEGGLQIARIYPRRYLVTNRACASVAIATLLPSCCQHDQVIKAHETRRPAFSNHSDPAPHATADNRRGTRRRTRDLQADGLSRHRGPDRPAGTDPWRGRGRLRAGGGAGPAASDADPGRNRGRRSGRPMGGPSQRPRLGARGRGPDCQDRRRRAGTASALCPRAGDRYAAGAEPCCRWSRYVAGARPDPRGPEDRAVLSRRTGPRE